MSTKRRNTATNSKRSPNKTSELIKRKYKSNYLLKVVARVDFAKKIDLLESNPPKDLVHTINKKNFRNFSEKEIQLQQLKFTSDSQVSQQKSVSYDWRYQSKNKGKIVSLNPECMWINYTKYSKYELLESDFITILTKLNSICGGLEVERLGLRYINNIELPGEKNPTVWKGYLSENLLGSFKLADKQESITRAFSLLEFDYDDHRMRFQYGMHNPDYPSVIKKKIFTLDYDVYSVDPVPIEDLAIQLNSFHKKIKMSFEEVITNKLRNKMGIK